jgi:hypothetical protein
MDDNSRRIVGQFPPRNGMINEEVLDKISSYIIN